MSNLRCTFRKMTLSWTVTSYNLVILLSPFIFRLNNGCKVRYGFPDGCRFCVHRCFTRKAILQKRYCKHFKKPLNKLRLLQAIMLNLLSFKLLEYACPLLNLKSVGFWFESAIWRSEGGISLRYLEITPISWGRKNYYFWLARDLNRLNPRPVESCGFA